MTKERAKYILDNSLFGGSLKYAFSGKYGAGESTTYEDGITQEESKFIRDVWDQMDGSSSFNSALCKISRGEVPAV